MYIILSANFFLVPGDLKKTWQQLKSYILPLFLILFGEHKVEQKKLWQQSKGYDAV